LVDLALRPQFHRARTLWLGLALTRNLAWGLAFLLTSGLFAYHLDRWLVLSPAIRFAWGLGTLLAALLIAAGWGWWSVRHRPDDHAIALRLERRHPHLRERLLSAVELARLPEAERERYSPGLLLALQREAEAAAGDLDFRRAVSPREALPALVTCGVLAVVALVHGVLAPAAVAAWWGRMTHPGADIPVYRDTRVRIAPRQALLLRGGDLTVTVGTEGKPVDRAQLHFRVGGGSWTKVALREPFRHRLQGLADTAEYYATAGDGQSDRGIARVVDPPAVVGLRLRYRYPEYMARPAQEVTGVSGILSVPLGTHVELTATASKPLASAVMDGAARPVSLAVEGAAASGTATILSDTVLSLRLRDTDGFDGRAPRGVEFHAVPDNAPEVRLEKPQGDMDVVSDAAVPLMAGASDDNGVRRLWLSHRRETGGRQPAKETGSRLALAEGAPTRRGVEVQARWNLSTLNLRPGDQVVYRAEADDYDNLRGPNVGQSPEQRLRIVDRAEMERRLAEGWQEWDRQLGDVIQAQTEARAALRAARTPAALAEAERRQRELAPRAEELSRRAGELAEMARTNRLSAEATVARQERAAAELGQIAQQAMPEAADRIRQSATQPAQRPVAAARQAEISRQLEALRRQAQPETDLEALARRAEELARAQVELQVQSQRLLPETLGLTAGELGGGQRGELVRMSRSQVSLQQATGQFEGNLGRAARASQPPAVAAARFMREQAVPERQGQASRQVTGNLLARAAAGQQAVAADLRRVAALLRQSQQNANQAGASGRQQSIARAQRQLERMLQQHAELMRRTAARPNAAESRRQAQQERALRQQAQRMAQQLQRQGMSPQSMREAQQQMQRAEQQLQRGAPQQAESPQQRAQEAMRQMAQQLQDARSDRQADAARERLRRDLAELARRQGEISRALQKADDAESQKSAAPRLAPHQESVSRSAQGVERRLPSETFRSTMGQARDAMKRAQSQLRQGEAGDNTRSASRQAERLLQQMARALEQQNPNNGQNQPGGQQGGQQGQTPPNGQELAQRLADLRLLRSLEQSLREETTEAESQAEGQSERLRDLARRQAQARRMTDQAQRALRQFPGVSRRVGEASGAMGQAQQGLQGGSAGEETQGAQGTAVMRLTQAIGQGQQQLQAMGRAPQPGQRQGNQSSSQQREGGQQPALDSVAVRGSDEGGPRSLLPEGRRGFGLLSPGDQQALRQGSREKVPADYADLVRRYYRALSERGK
jgi:hypothetical protein